MTPFGWEGKKLTQDTAECGEKVHFEINQKGKARDENLEGKWKEGCLSGRVRD